MPPEQRRVLVTGAGSGIGRALAVEAARRGMAVALVGRRREALAETAALLPPDAQRLILPADVTDNEQRRWLTSEIASVWGDLNVLVNNAGVVLGGAAARIGDDALAQLFAINAIAPMALARDFLPLLVKASGAKVVNVGSMFGDIPYPGFAAYSASKFALRGYSTALRREWSSLGIDVIYAAPRATRTDAAVAFANLIAATGMKLDPPDLVARQVWDACELRRQSVYPRGPERLFVLLQRLFPKLIDRALAKQTATLN